MRSSTAKYAGLVLLAALLGLQPARAGTRTIRRSVVKIYATVQRSDYTIPWQSSAPGSGTGSGFIIDKRRILTNAHVVSDARFIEVQKDGSPTRYRARVMFIGHDCDLATLAVEDESFFEDTRSVRFARAIPALNEEVTVFGYPMGGARLSVTRGVVSRIDYGPYSHSGVDQHLVLQVDAAINPGNSGGPVIFDGKVVGLAFQGLAAADNIGYAIPLPVLQHFINDIDDGHYHGYPEMGVSFVDVRNAALRRDLALPDNKTGVAVYYVDPYGSAAGGLLQPRDVLLDIDGYDIANDGTVELDGNNVLFSELLERKQWGDSVVLNVWRDSAQVCVEVPLTNPPDPFVFRNVYDEQPRYYVLGGLVFVPLNREYLKALGRTERTRATQQLFYYNNYAKVDGHHVDRQDFVFLLRRLPHPVNTYADNFIYGVVKEVNGQPIRKLSQLPAAADRPQNGFHVIRFEGMDDSLVLDAAAVAHADPAIFAAYGVPARQHLADPNGEDE